MQEAADLKRQLKKEQEEKEQLKEENLMLNEGKLPGSANTPLPQANYPNLKPQPIKPAASHHRVEPAVSQPSQSLQSSQHSVTTPAATARARKRRRSSRST